VLLSELHYLEVVILRALRRLLIVIFAI